MLEIHIDNFWGYFPNPPDQPAVGDSPQAYLEKLNELCGLALVWPNTHPIGQLTRAQLRKLCRDPNIDVLIAYAAVMAWGGRGVDSRNYRLSLEENSRTELRAILTHLRTSTTDRQTDFDAMKRAAGNIKGLGISFYTKLLFFFRGEPDAYILDQFTAKSAKLLFDPCLVILTTSGYPCLCNTPGNYEQFCTAVEALAATRTPPPHWTGEQVEQAMFDGRDGQWRKYMRSGSMAHSLPSLIVRTHAAANRAGRDLPGENPQISEVIPIRIHCSTIDGVIWQYAIHKAKIHAEVFIPFKHIARYNRLRDFLGVMGHDFGDGITGNGARNGRTRSLKLTIPHGLNSSQNEWVEISRRAVSAMNILFNRACENL